jgi:hypothetical protein
MKKSFSIRLPFFKIIYWFVFWCPDEGYDAKTVPGSFGTTGFSAFDNGF